MPYLCLATPILICFMYFSQLPTVGMARQTEPNPTEVPPNPQVLIQEVVENGLHAKDKDQTHWAYREIVHKDGRLETREVFQTNAGSIDRLIAVNNQPLSSEQQRREDIRIQTLLADPAEIRKERQKQREDSARQSRMYATFPEAFRYQYAGQEGGLIKLNFEPNPQFVPNNRQEEVFHHLEGVMWIDPEQKQLTRIDGQLTSEVKFAGGLLGHLDKGGVFSVRFKPLESGQWVMAALHVEMNGRALLFKTIAVQEEREFDDYRRLPDDLSLREAADLLGKDLTSPRQSAANAPK